MLSPFLDGVVTKRFPTAPFTFSDGFSGRITISWSFDGSSSTVESLSVPELPPERFLSAFPSFPTAALPVVDSLCLASAFIMISPVAVITFAESPM